MQNLRLEHFLLLLKRRNIQETTPQQFFLVYVGLYRLLKFDTTLVITTIFFQDTCNFEKGLCGFIEDSTGNFNWSLDKGGTPSSSTGPTVDHTFGTSAG